MEQPTAARVQYAHLLQGRPDCLFPSYVSFEKTVLSFLTLLIITLNHHQCTSVNETPQKLDSNERHIKHQTVVKMGDTSLPTEVLEMIIEDFIYKYTEPTPKDPVKVKFIPRWYLTTPPPPRVPKRWYAVCAKYLYCPVAVGGSAPFELLATEEESADERRQIYARQKTRSI